MVININEITDILGLEDQEVLDLDGSNSLKDYSFDSLAIVLLQSFLDEECNIQIDPDDLPKFENISDLDTFIEFHKKNAQN
tara:strand:- start:1174 stop:1416 length:243 start_codon:yes stop_codon:yes gene_type:complete